MRCSEYEAISMICNSVNDAFVVTSVGNISKIIYDIKGADRNVFYMLGSMGLSVSFGLGLAMAYKSKHILSFIGDGAAFMNLGSFILLGRYSVNYTVVVIDNGLYNTTGGQKSGSDSFEWNSFLNAAGIKKSYWCNTLDQLSDAVSCVKSKNELAVIVVKVQPFYKRLKRVQVMPEECTNNIKG